MASAMDLSLVFLSGLDKKALRRASREYAHDPRSLQERLLAMTRRANDGQMSLAILREEYNDDVRDQEAMQFAYVQQTALIRARNERVEELRVTNRDLARQVRELQPAAVVDRTEPVDDIGWIALAAEDDYWRNHYGGGPP